MTAITTRAPRTRREARDVGGIALVVVAVLLVTVIVAAPLLSPFSPSELVAAARTPPSATHPFGTDQLGRDVLSRTLWGGRETLFMAVLATALATVIGVPLGIFAGYVGRARAAVTMRLMDILLAFPGLLLALVVITIAGSGEGPTIIAVGISFIPVFARVMYGTTQKVRAEEYIAASQVVGASSLRIMVQDVLPVVSSEIVVLVSSAIGWTTLLGTGLNFLGFGVSAPTAEWGVDLNAGSAYLAQAPWISAAPGLGITITILLANFLGDYLTKRLNAAPILQAEASRHV